MNLHWLVCSSLICLSQRHRFNSIYRINTSRTALGIPTNRTTISEMLRFAFCFSHDIPFVNLLQLCQHNCTAHPGWSVRVVPRMLVVECCCSRSLNTAKTLVCVH